MQTVELRVLAEPDQLSVVRATVVTVAATLDLAIDAISDARIATDEACTSLMQASSENAVLTCRMSGVRHRIAVRCATTVDENEPFPIKGLSWHVLSALTTDLTTGTDRPPPGSTLRTAWIGWSIADDLVE
jgi:serine/threonine-protein kinase RsbW